MLSLARDRSRMQRPKCATLFVWDFTQQSAGALVLPTGLTFARASSGHTVQNGASAIVTAGITSNDVGRVGRLSSAHSYGIFVEPARTNFPFNTRSQSSAGWSGPSLSTMTYNAAAGPDGAVVAAQNNTTSGGFGRYASVNATIGQPYTASVWMRAVSGTSEYRLGLVQNTGAWSYAGGPGQTVTTAWSRKDVTRVQTAPEVVVLIIPFDGSARATPSVIAAQAANLYTDLVQVEVGKYPTSAIINTGASLTRAAERLSIDSTRGGASVVGGRVGIYLRLRALAASTELGSGEGWLLYWPVGDGGWYVDDATRAIYGYNGAAESETAAAAISWARGDLLEFAIECGSGTSAVRWRVNGGSTNTASFATHNDSWAAVVGSSGFDVCNVAGGGQMPSIVEVVSTFVPGRGPF